MEIDMPKIFLAVLAVGGALAVSPAAQADVIYQFVITSESPTLSALPLAAFAPTLTITDAAYASGTLNYTFTGQYARECNNISEGNSPCIVNGSGFVSLKNHDKLTGNTKTDEGYVFANITLQPNEGLSGSLNTSAFAEEDYSLSGTGDAWTGYFDTDVYSRCGFGGPAGHTCTYTGYWEEVPEPPTATLMIAGLFGLGWINRRKFI
jgi:hypothetical protein